MSQTGSQRNDMGNLSYEHPENERRFNIGIVLNRDDAGTITAFGRRGIDPEEERIYIRRIAEMISVRTSTTADDIVGDIRYEKMEMGPWDAHVWWSPYQLDIQDVLELVEEMFHSMTYPFLME